MSKALRVKLTDVKKLAKNTGKTLKGGEILALIGPLGSGKTTFTKALGKALGVKQKITSPSFTLMHVLPLKLKSRPMHLYHLDLYRLKGFREVKALGITEIWGKKNTITIIEWANKIKKYLPKKTLFIYFSHE